MTQGRIANLVTIWRVIAWRSCQCLNKQPLERTLRFSVVHTAIQQNSSMRSARVFDADYSVVRRIIILERSEQERPKAAPAVLDIPCQPALDHPGEKTPSGMCYDRVRKGRNGAPLFLGQES